MLRSAFAVLALLAAAPATFGGEARIVSAEARETGAGWRFDVTVRHADEGWDHYADAWQVLGPDGDILGTRELAHPHVSEQPFTRSLSRVRIPDDVRSVTLRVRDSVHGWGGETLELELPR